MYNLIECQRTRKAGPQAKTGFNYQDQNRQCNSPFAFGVILLIMRACSNLSQGQLQLFDHVDNLFFGQFGVERK